MYIYYCLWWRINSL